MSCQLLTMVFLASLGQERKERRPIPAPPARGQIVNIHVGIARNGNADIRQITLSMPAPADDEEERPAPRNMPFNILTSVVDPENFDRWVFDDEQSEADRFRHLDDILQSKVDTAAKAHKLTDAQRAKLRLAGRGDIKRFLDQVEERRQDFEKERHNFRTGFAALQRLNPLAQIYREGAFGDGSLFAKTLSRINNEQKAVRDVTGQAIRSADRRAFC
jgi:hypothetical protein